MTRHRTTQALLVVVALVATASAQADAIIRIEPRFDPAGCGGIQKIEFTVELTEPVDGYQMIIPDADLIAWLGTNCTPGCGNTYVHPLNDTFGGMPTCPHLSNNAVRFLATSTEDVPPGNYILAYLAAPPGVTCLPDIIEPVAEWLGMRTMFVRDGVPIPTTWVPYVAPLNTRCCLAAGCSGDINGDCRIDVTDLLEVLQGWIFGLYNVPDLLDVLGGWGGWCSLD